MVAQTKARGFEAADIFKKNIEALQVRYKPYNDDGSVPSSKEMSNRLHLHRMLYYLVQLLVNRKIVVTVI